MAIYRLTIDPKAKLSKYERMAYADAKRFGSTIRDFRDSLKLARLAAAMPLHRHEANDNRR